VLNLQPNTQQNKTITDKIFFKTEIYFVKRLLLNALLYCVLL